MKLKLSFFASLLLPSYSTSNFGCMPGIPQSGILNQCLWLSMDMPVGHGKRVDAPGSPTEFVVIGWVGTGQSPMIYLYNIEQNE